jgi:hypothetical protein
MNSLSNLTQIPTLAILGLYVWSIVWKGLALWKAANLKQRNWFIGVLLLNTLGILDIIYLFFFAKKKMTLGELKFWEKK